MAEQRVPSIMISALGLVTAATAGGCDAAEIRNDGQGKLTVALHDAPADDLEALLIQADSVAIRNAGTDEWIRIPARPGTIDLLALDGGITVDLLVDAPIPAGDYDELRIVLAASPTAVIAGEPSTVDVPSATASGLKVKGAFSVAAGGCTKIAVDFDAQQSLERTHKGYRLAPVLRIDRWSDACGPSPSSCQWNDPDCDLCVPDVVAAFSRNRTHGYPLRLGRGSQVGFPLSEDKHYQGCARFGTSLICSRSGAGISLETFELASRSDPNAPLYSNILSHELVAYTPAPAGDHLISLLGYQAGDPDPGSGHSGGVDKEGYFLAVPMEGGGTSSVALYDVHDPHAIVRIATIEHRLADGSISDEAGTASLARLPEGDYLLIIGRKDARHLDFYRSQSLDQPESQLVSSWHAQDSLRGVFLADSSELPDGDRTWEAYQSLSAIVQCDGSLFLLGMHDNALWNKVLGDDWADLYRVDFAGTEPEIAKVAKKHFWCDWEGARQCNFDAAGGMWISPQREIVMLSTEHAVNGYDWSVKAMEFVPDVPATKRACPTVESSWIEFYDDDNFRDRSLHITWGERFLEPLENLDLAEHFEDKISSVRFCGAPGVVAHFYEHKQPCGGRVLELVGTGQVQNIADLRSLDFGDKASCIKLTSN